jgi:hypothetical protein
MILPDPRLAAKRGCHLQAELVGALWIQARTHKLRFAPLEGGTRSQRRVVGRPDGRVLWRRITLWLDLNSNEIGWIGNDRSQIAAQKEGEAIWPPVDIDPKHPTGVEKDLPVE